MEAELSATLWSPGELRSLAELLEEVNDGDDREDREEVTVRETQTRGSDTCLRTLTWLAQP